VRSDAGIVIVIRHAGDATPANIRG
jgi:hypothetical protein